MSKLFYTILIVIVACLSSFSFATAQNKSDAPKMTKAESQEVREFVKRFGIRFLKSKDLKPLLSEFYFDDFIDRYRKYSYNDEGSAKIFVPGIFYDRKILAEGSSEDWRRFYVSAHNFIFLGVVAALKSIKTSPDKKANFDIIQFYSPSGVELLSKNPNLANTIIKKNAPKPISSIEEMLNATATLEEVVNILQQKKSDELLLEVNDKEWAKVLNNDNYFKSDIELADEGEFGFPKNTRLIFVKTPIGLELVLAKDKDKLKIVWASINFD